MTRQRAETGLSRLVVESVDSKIAESSSSGRWSDAFEVWIGPGSDERKFLQVFVVDRRYIDDELRGVILLELNEDGAVDLARRLLEATAEL